jgi:predicted nucleotidyltransferase component of viral defense system
LDFAAKEENVLEGLKEAAENLSDYGVEAEIDKIEEKKISLNCRLKYRGPLYQGSEKSIGTIDIEISKREDVFLDPEWTRLFFEYPDIRVVNALGLAKKELLAEKLRALTGRNKPRDLYDCWFLIKQGVDLDRGLFEKKIEVVDGASEVSIEVTEDMWEDDLNLFLENPPEFQQVLNDVEASLENKGFTVRTE